VDGGAKEARLFREKHVSEDPTRKRLVLSRRLRPCPRKASTSRANIHNIQMGGKRSETPSETAYVPKSTLERTTTELRLNSAHPCANAKASTSCVSLERQSTCSIPHLKKSGPTKIYIGKTTLFNDWVLSQSLFSQFRILPKTIR